jgi:CheY-like chemotaxis protein/HPt (histidine-containing phosphotransfer) domain-containing protein
MQAAADQGIDGSLGGMHFLLVEDNLLNQAVARGILELGGATLDVVDNGQQAVDRMSENPGLYDLVLMDMQMPVMDGFTATRLLRQELQLTLPIIAMTAGVLESERERSLEAGITDFIPKPIEVEEMLAVLQKHLPKKAAKAVPAAAVAAPAPTPAPAATAAPVVAAVAAAAKASAPETPAYASVKLVSSPVPAGEASAFNVDSLMRVMGRDAKGRAVMVKMVRGAIDSGMEPVEQADRALREGRPRDAARLFHGLRGAVGVLGARRLIQATIDAETAIGEARDEELAQRVEAVRAELEQTLAEARAWLDRQAS